MPELIIQRYGLDKSIEVISNAMDDISRKDCKIQDLILPILEKLEALNQQHTKNSEFKKSLFCSGLSGKEVTLCSVVTLETQNQKNMDFTSLSKKSEPYTLYRLQHSSMMHGEINLAERLEELRSGCLRRIFLELQASYKKADNDTWSSYFNNIIHKNKNNSIVLFSAIVSVLSQYALLTSDDQYFSHNSYF